MIILTTSTAEQTIRIIPREYPDDVTLILRDDSTNTETTYTLESMEWENTDEEWQTVNLNWNSVGGYYEDKGYLVIQNEYALTENRFYDLTIKEGSSVIYKDKIFCTDQTIADYSVNNGEYVTEDSYDNDYIII
jgi:hypothetical protein